MGNNARDGAIDFIGGVVGGVASVYVSQPLDTVKLKMQTFPVLYKNAFHCFRTTLLQEGIVRGLYAGTVPSLVANVSEKSILLMSYGMCQKVIVTISQKEKTDQLNLIEKASAGSMAAFFAAFTLCPTQLIKCQLQAWQQQKDAGKLPQISTRIGPYFLAKEILRREGIRGMYRGLVSTFARDIPGCFFYFGGYETSRRLLSSEGKKAEDLGHLSVFLCGACGGMSFWLLVYPIDTIKSRIQIESHTQGILRTFVSVVKTEGFGVLYKGLGPVLLRTLPYAGAFFLVYEATRTFLKRAISNIDY